MGYSRDNTWAKGDGFCPICGNPFVRKNGVNGQRGAWQVDHSNPQSRGGTDSPRNLNAVCAKCNNKRSDGDRSLAETRRRTQANSTGGRIIDGFNRIKKEDILLDKLPDIKDGFAGASRKRFWK